MTLDSEESTRAGDHHDDPDEERAELGAEPAEPDRARRLSVMLAAIAADESRERIAISDLLAVMDERAIAALMFVFAVPNVLPTPPGTSSLLAAPLLFLALQLTLGLKPWLPRLVGARSLARKDFAAVVARVGPWLARAERLLKPRLTRFVVGPAENVVGAVCLLLAAILFLPVPLGNMLPALAICLMGLGVLERDGLWVIAGVIVALLSVGVVWGVVYALVVAAVHLVAAVFAL